MSTLRVAIEGCCHGQLDQIYSRIAELECQNNFKVDLLLICGDFQSIRNLYDLSQMSVPDKYKQIGNFYKYYNGEKLAPIPTIFVGGNHEASNYLFELFHGGFVCPNIYYLGNCGVVNFGGIRICGISGIYKPFHYELGYFEKQPFVGMDLKSIYHVRKTTIFKMAQIKAPIDIFLSHDWPRGIARHGDKEGLLKFKGFLRKEIDDNSLGSPPSESLLLRLKPKFWFAAHLHCRFEAFVKHKSSKKLASRKDCNEISISDSGTESDSEDKNLDLFKDDVVDDLILGTQFLSLDKCLPKRSFLEILDIPTSQGGPKDITLDREWMAIMRATNKLNTLKRTQSDFPDEGDIQKYFFLKRQIAIEKVWIDKNMKLDGFYPPPFIMTAQAYIPVFNNPQTIELCKNIGIENIINPNGSKTDRPDETASELQSAKERLLAMIG